MASKNETHRKPIVETHDYTDNSMLKRTVET